MTDSEAPTRPRASVVVAVRGNAAALTGLAAALAGQDVAAGDLELIVVDNHHRPQISARCVENPSVPTRVVHETRPGLSRARNTGIRAARGDYVLITDPDARPVSSWVRQLVAALEHTGAYCAGGKVVPRWTGTRPLRLDPRVAQLFVPPAWPDRVVPLAAPYWLVGCNLGFRRDPLPRFDERFGVRGRWHLSCEDLEIVVRTERAEWGVVVVPDAVVARAIHPADRRVSALVGRALWHGVSIARLVNAHPDTEIYDSDRVRDALRSLRPTSWLPALTDLARIVGLRAESTRLAVRAGLGRVSAR
ncbi:MAG: glycosyltransferase family 2 protein [Pseudonocardiaceae bacterium]